MKKLKQKLNKAGIELVFKELEGNGYFEKTFRIMFVNQNLSEEEMKRVIYHELKHGLDHVEFAALYNLPVYHSKMENEANVYMIDQIIEDNGGQFDYSWLIEEFDIGMGYDIRYAR